MKRIVSYNDSLAFVAEIQSDVVRGRKHIGEEGEPSEGERRESISGSAERADRQFTGVGVSTAPDAQVVKEHGYTDAEVALEAEAGGTSSAVVCGGDSTKPAVRLSPRGTAAESGPPLKMDLVGLAPDQQGIAQREKVTEADQLRSPVPRHEYASSWPLSWGVEQGAQRSTSAGFSTIEQEHHNSEESALKASSLLHTKAPESGVLHTSPMLGVESFPLNVNFEEHDSPEAYGGIRDAFIDRHRALPGHCHLPPTLDVDGNVQNDARLDLGRAGPTAPSPLSEPPQALCSPDAATRDSHGDRALSRSEQIIVLGSDTPERGVASSGSDAFSTADTQTKRVCSALDLPEMATPAGQTKYMVRKLVIVMAGLPARGKSHIAQQVARYLNWLGHRAAIFNVGVMRRRLMKSSDCDASFFSPENEQGMRLRWEFARQTLNEMNQWLFDENGQVGIYDATNSTKTRRRFVREYLENLGIRVLFLESIVNDERIVEQNILATKLNSPDYRDRDAEYAVRDFKNRLRNYERANEAITEDEGCSYVKIIDGGKKFVLYNLKGHLQSKIVSYLTSVHIIPRLIYLSRHGESEWNVTGQLGGDPPITRRGEAYAKRLSEFLQREFRGRSPPTVWCSQLRRTWLTVRHIPTDICICWRSLNEINAGICEGMTYEQIKRELPDVWEARKADKLRYRYPGGESYLDVIHRVEPIILEIERQTKPLLIVAHNAIIRSIYAFFKGLKQEQVPYVDIPLHTLICLRTRPYGCDERRYKLLRDEVPLDRARTPEPSDSESHPAATSPSPASSCGVAERVWFDDIESIP
ncbi:hypothetical protein CCYA_CCYA08G2434 [Cyanidiococcus yangmingshanensis]|nr:hypothetical protein CCYA_CCYA08G2434 [Cyanidiococcus yangmingshanensis]